MTRSRGLRNPKGTRQRWVDENQGRIVCACGCGEAIPLKPEHFHKPPRYLHGHNARVTPPRGRKPPPEPCECGCDQLAAKGRRFVSGHNSRLRKHTEETKRKMSAARMGKNHGMIGPGSGTWKGGIQRTLDGYVLQYASEHPFARRRYVMQHRLVAETQMRSAEPVSPFLIKVDGVLYLRPEAEVHHINGDRADNRPENLTVMSKADHARHHHAERSRS